ncbi:hypothetical protein [Shewanella gelidii]|nr:hypothetical protein [Shewanella gelidii]MCL1098646.1 hypothetical protein [Shewanella gelidii]
MKILKTLVTSMLMLLALNSHGAEPALAQLEADILAKQAKYEALVDDYQKKRQQLEAAITELKQQEQVLMALKNELAALNSVMTEARAAESQTRPLKAENQPLAKKTGIGAEPDEEPCTCVFNSNRKYNPEKVLWNNAYWICEIYKTDGTCSAVKKIKDVSID